jgi:GDPmannose 4,6-dehydratase
MIADARTPISAAKSSGRSMKRALVFGVTGQDGSYMAEILLEKGYEVHGVARSLSAQTMSRIESIERLAERKSLPFYLHRADLADVISLNYVLERANPQEIYNFAAQSHVGDSFVMAEHTSNTTGLGALRILEAVRTLGMKSRYYQASSAEMFGDTPPPQNEESPFRPRSPYATSKLYAYWMARNYREAYSMHATNGILFNHESPRRGLTFVTRKITRAVARIAAGMERNVTLGNLDAVRDWGYAPEYMECVWRMLQRDEPDDYVVATGNGFSVRQFAEAAFQAAGLEWKDHVVTDRKLHRPNEVSASIGDASKAAQLLGWKATTLAPELAEIMVAADMNRLRRLRSGEDVKFGGPRSSG